MLCVLGAAQAMPLDFAPVPVERARPQYPLELRKQNITGEVVVEFIVTKDGDVRNAFVVSATHPDFGPAAVASVSSWKFKPGMKAGRAVNTRMQVPIYFNLDGLSGPQIFRALDQDSYEKLPEGMRYDLPPKNEMIEPGVHPLESLLENRRVEVLGAALVSANGSVNSVLWKTENLDEAIKGASMAMLDTARLAPALRGKTAVATTVWFRINFDASNGDVRISDSSASILKKLRLEGKEAKFADSRDLDGKVTALERKAPRFPRLARLNVDRGKALIEFYIDGEGHAQLPRVISASEPAFGYSACQAIAQWQFSPPLKDGKPVVVKVRVPVEFKRE